MKTILWKKKHTIAVLTAFIAMFLPLKGYAEIVAYGLAIAGNKVTSANCNDLSKLDGVSGKVCYDPYKQSAYAARCHYKHWWKH